MDWVKLEGEERSRMSYRHEERLEANRGVKRPWAGFVFFFHFILFRIFLFYFISEYIRTWNKVALHQTDTRTKTDVST